MEPMQGEGAAQATARETIVESAGDTNVPNLSGDIRHLIPKLGLREYWYPALKSKEVGRNKPKRVRLLGVDLCFFRSKEGTVVALDDVCPHRGGRLSEGRCRFRGTVSCPYHGWTFDSEGRNVAVLSEGPDSHICGKPGTTARKYPTEELKGVVFVWMGQGEPAPIEQDVPEELFDSNAHIMSGVKYWSVNWELGLENSMDAHVPYLHINAWWILLAVGLMPFGAVGGDRPVWVGNGFSGERVSAAARAYFPSVGRMWPKTNYRRWWTWLFRLYFKYVQKTRKMEFSPSWEWGHHLPGMFRTGLVFDYMTRQCVAVDENTTRLWYFHAAPGRRWWQRLLHNVEYKLFIHYLHDEQFSGQDMIPMRNQRWDTPEMLSVTDSEVVLWRRLVATKHFRGRNAKFRFQGKSLVGKEGLAADAGDGSAPGWEVEASLTTEDAYLNSSP